MRQGKLFQASLYYKRNQMKKILVPVSGAQSAYESAEYAMKVAKVTNAEVHVLHVVATDEDPDTMSNSLKMFERASKELNVRVIGHSVSGKVVDQIIDYAEANEVDLILMGASNGLVVDKWISNEVLGYTAIPVLVMPYQAFDLASNEPKSA